MRLVADAAVLVAEAGLRHVGGNGASAHGADEGQGSDDAQSDLLHKRTPIENTKTICDSSQLPESMFFGHTGAATERKPETVALYPERLQVLTKSTP
jgi:hypothetical protein